MTAGATPSLTIGTPAAKDSAIVQDKACHIAAIALICNNGILLPAEIARCRNLPSGIRQAPILFLIEVCFREDVFGVELLILHQCPADLGSLQDSVCDICGCGLCSGKLGCCHRLILRCLFIVRRAPCALVSDGILRHFLDFAAPCHAAQDKFHKCPGVVAQIAGLDAAHELLVIFKVAFAGCVLARRRAAKEPRLRNMAHSGQHSTGIVQNVFNTRHRQGLNADILAVCVDKDHIQQVAGKVKHFHTLKNCILTVCRRKHIGKVLHLVGCHRQPFQQANGIARSDACVPQFLTDAHILRDAPRPVEVGQRRSFWDVGIMENQATGRMHGVVAVHAAYLIILRDAGAALAVVFIVRIVLIPVDPQREHFIPAIHQQFINAVHIPPVQRFLQEPTIIHQHNDSSTTKQPGPPKRL